MAAVASLALTSCVEKVQPHEPGEPEASGCYGVYFPTQDASGSHVYNPTQEKVIDITVARTNTSGAITVPVKMSFSEDGIFEAAPVTFADGQEETTFSVRFDKAKEGVEYVANLVIEDNQYASKYNASAIGLDFSVLCVEMKYFLDPKTNEKALVTFNQGWWGEVATGYIKYYEVDDVRTCFTETIDHLYNGALTVAPGFWGYGADYEWTFTWYIKQAHPTVEGATLIQLPWQPTGYVRDDLGMIYLGDYVSEQNFWGQSYDWMTEAKAASRFTPSYYDGNGGFYFSVYAYANAEGRGWAADPFETVGVASGFTRVDYSLELEADYTYDGETPIYVEAGVDVENVKYAFYEGELTATQIGYKVDGIVAGTEATTTFSNFAIDEELEKKVATMKVAPQKTGMYTLVAVAYDKDNKAQESASILFKHIAGSDSQTYAVDVDVFTEDTPTRYHNFHDYDSFAYCVSGSDLTEIHVAIYSEDVVAKYGGEAILADAKSDASYALSADQVAEANADGGFYDIASGLKANTTYYVIVWATNGNLDEYAMDAYTTGKLPYVWKSLGKGQYTDDVACGLYDIDPITVPCDVEEEQSTPGLYRLSGFQLPLVAIAYDMSEAAISAYEGVVWRNSPIIIDATDPSSVTIELQDYGVCFSTKEGFIDGVTSLYNGKPFSIGTLKDGVISFPTAKGLLCTLDGDGYYYANQHGAFKLVLPAAAGQSSIPAYSGPVFDGTASAQKMLYAPAKVKYERDPKAIEVNVKISYDRKPKDSASPKAAGRITSVK